VIVIPAIDLRGGRVVRLVRGGYQAETVYEEDPAEAARRFEAEGARRLHVVDLDAARGIGSNRDVVREICREVAIPVQVGGGLRTIDAVDRAIGNGAARAILGTVAAIDPSLVVEAVGRFGERIVVAVDVRQDRLMTHGWQAEGPRLEEALPILDAAGAPRYLVTAIARDGTLEGPDLDLYRRVLALTERPVIASGGVRTAADVRALRDLSLEAAVVGKAMYEGTLRMVEVARG